MKTIKDAVSEQQKLIDDRIIKKGGKHGDCITQIDIKEGFCVLLSPSEFDARAKELGFVNGYRYGIEYPINGKRPELAGDVGVTTWHRSGCKKTGFIVLDSDWSSVELFKITDPRYKPADTSYLNALSQDGSLTHSGEGLTHSEWHERGELPPISTQCEWKGLNVGFWVQCEVIDKYQDKEMVVFNTGEYRNCRYEILKLDSVQFRPIRTEREKVIEAAVKIYDDKKCFSAESFASELHKAGMLVLPPKKSDTKD